MEPFTVGINPEMDKHAHDHGLTDWFCISPNSNNVWLRRDGKIAMNPWDIDEIFKIEMEWKEGYVTDLRIIDSEYPLEEEANAK